MSPNYKLKLYSSSKSQLLSRTRMKKSTLFLLLLLCSPYMKCSLTNSDTSDETCQDINALCKLEPAFLLDILCQIETVSQQCPKRCNSCSETGNNDNNGGPTTADTGPADNCAGVSCTIPNEECDPTDGVCKCGIEDTCEGKTNAPTCSRLTNPRSCQCGNEPLCGVGQTCDAATGQCCPGLWCRKTFWTKTKRILNNI